MSVMRKTDTLPVDIGGAYIDENKATVYCADATKETVLGTKPDHWVKEPWWERELLNSSWCHRDAKQTGVLLDWTGDTILGTYQVLKRGQKNGRLYVWAYLYATEKQYHGSTEGPGMICHLTAYKDQGV